MLHIHISHHITCVVCTGVDAVEIKTEADSDDMSECPHDDQPTAGIGGEVSDFVFSDLLLSDALYKHELCHSKMSVHPHASSVSKC